MTENEDSSKLKRGLKNRHLQMIALGTAVGTGPAVSLTYLIGGVIIFFIVRMLGEMSVDEPVSGSFSYYASKYWSDLAGFIAGWNYWFLYVVMGMAELTAVGIYLAYWFPDTPQWIGILICLVVITAINLVTVSAYGEVEFWMALIKISAIIFMIIFGTYLIFTSGKPFPENFSNLWIHGGFFPNGLWGMMLSMVPVLFSFGGIELIGITAGEAENPDKTLPRAINQVIYRILIFYVGTMIVLMSLWSWKEVGTEASPFVQIFEKLGITSAANILNFVVLSAAVSVYNSASYSGSRMLYGMAETSNAPKIFAKLSERKVPVNGILFSSGITLIAVILNFLFPNKVFMYLLSIVTGAIIVTWAMIILTHLKFRKHCALTGHKTKFPSILYPFTNYLALAFLAVVVVLMATIDEMRVAVICTPIWLIFIWLCYKYKTKT